MAPPPRVTLTLSCGYPPGGSFIGQLNIEFDAAQPLTSEQKMLAAAQPLVFSRKQGGEQRPEHTLLGKEMRNHLQWFAALAACVLQPDRAFIPFVRLPTLPVWDRVRKPSWEGRLSALFENDKQPSFLPLLEIVGGQGFRLAENVTPKVSAEHRTLIAEWLAKEGRAVEDGERLLRECRDAGLVAIYLRTDHRRPKAFQLYQRADREIVIVGTTGHQSVLGDKQHLEALTKALDNSQRRVYLVILHPDSPDLRDVSPDAAAKLKRVLDRLRQPDFASRSNLTVRFTSRLPPYSAIMIDGDLEGHGFVGAADGEVRIQPLSLHSSPYARGVMLHFRRNPEVPNGGFEYFVDDLRARWRKEAKEDPARLAAPPSPSGGKKHRSRSTPGPAHRSR